MSRAVVWIALLVVIGLVFIALGIRQYHAYVLYRDTPTGKIQSAPLGRVKLTGTAREATEPVTLPFAETEFVYAKWDSIPRKNDNETRIYQIDASGIETVPFYLEDDSGQVLVADPVQATVVTTDTSPSTTDRLVAVVVETIFGVSDDSKQIAVGDEVTVFGQIVPYSGPPGPIEDAERILERDETTGQFLISTGENLDIATKYRRDAIWFLSNGLLLSTGCLAIWAGDVVPL